MLHKCRYINKKSIHLKRSQYIEIYENNDINIKIL